MLLANKLYKSQGPFKSEIHLVQARHQHPPHLLLKQTYKKKLGPTLAKLLHAPSHTVGDISVPIILNYDMDLALYNVNLV